nr:nucleotidyltransferase family protein [Auraticoccus cholistanensis]
MRQALKQAASALKASGVPFALVGGYALWAQGAPEPEHDVDFAVPEEEVEAAAAALAAAGFELERPPEDWLFKAHLGTAMVDVLHRLQGRRVDRALLEQSGEQEILGLRMPVMQPTEIMSAKLASLSEHYCDFAPLLSVARAVREQLDWQRLRSEAEEQPFAEAFLRLTERLGISPPA